VTGTAHRLGHRILGLRQELAKFGTVGIISLVVDTAVFNLLRETVLPDKPLTAKIISAVVSATNAFLLNRHWSFSARTKRRVHHEYALFIGINAVGLGFSLACLAVSHYVLGFDGRLADNIAANGVGLAFGTVFRFWAYRKFIWLAQADGQGRSEPALMPGS
jgi:putative flippase GtrA